MSYLGEAPASLSAWQRLTAIEDYQLFIDNFGRKAACHATEAMDSLKGDGADSQWVT